jgi:hypothetical protein
MPRLDVAFKKGPVPEARGPVAPIRVHWIKFLESLRDRHVELGHEVRVIEVPLWQITTDFVKDTSQMADRIYIPHKMRENWWLDERVHYYMQMVIPNIFSLDNKGWCATASSYPIRPDGDADSGVYEMLRARIKGNISKFDQPAHIIVMWRLLMLSEVLWSGSEIITTIALVRNHDILLSKVIQSILVLWLHCGKSIVICYQR